MGRIFSQYRSLCDSGFSLPNITFNRGTLELLRYVQVVLLLQREWILDQLINLYYNINLSVNILTIMIYVKLQTLNIYNSNMTNIPGGVSHVGVYIRIYLYIYIYFF